MGAIPAHAKDAGGHALESNLSDESRKRRESWPIHLCILGGTGPIAFVSCLSDASQVNFLLFIATSDRILSEADAGDGC